MNKREARQEYMRQYRLRNPEKWMRTPEQQAKINARKREQYAADEAFREIVKARSRVWQVANPEKRKANRLKVHGIGLSDYQDILAEQHGRCWICGYSDLSDPKMFPIVDHCHTTGRVRGLLCMNCNQGLGKFKDNPDLLIQAIAYLTRSG